jgi:uncharacterized protein (UPF0548 family)
MKFVRPSDSTAMGKMMEVLESAEPTYSDIGATLAGTPPDGFHHHRYEAVLGTGPETFQRAVAGLKAWEAHRLPGVRVFPHDQEISIGATVVVTLGTPILALAGAMPNRERHPWANPMGLCPRDAAGPPRTR